MSEQERIRLAELGQLYAALDIIRHTVRAYSGNVGRHLEQRDVDRMDTIAHIANGLIRRVMEAADAEKEPT